MLIVEQYGWNDSWSMTWKEWTNSSKNGPEPALVPARIIGDFGSKYKIMTAQGELWAELAGKLRGTLEDSGQYPAIGDWVAAAILDGDSRAVIHGVLPRHSLISRKAAGSVPQEQIIAANVDTLFLVSALNADFNVRRMERYLIMAWNSGARPVILLTKSDLCPDAEEHILEMERAAPGVAIHAVSAFQDQGREHLLPYIGAGQTVALTGSSGCGKSTLVNWLSSREVQLTQDVREGDSRGRHTTTRRELFILPDGGIIIDTPGMRELQLWEDGGGLEVAFGEISALAGECRYSDCRHEREEGCAVLAAVADGTLPEQRLLSYRKTQRELRFQTGKEQKQKRKGSAAAAKGSAAKPRDRSWRRQVEEF